ncbi:MAG TPA: secretin N-terminal domain-containing protein [Vicinamibacterales bacterium]|nr:secretin N-terminal domain-containing protein [Vicinamibacterales bacterium]
MHSHTRRALTIAVVLLAVITAGCGASRSFNQGESAARAGDWDAAVEHYRRAVQASPDRPDYVIALERASIAASQRHLDQARIFEVRGQLDEALREYRRASEFDPPNRQVAAKVTEVEHRIRDQAEAAQPRSNLNQMRENARQSGPPPLFNLTQVLPSIRFTNASLRDILGSIGMSAGINVTFDNTFQDRQYSVQMDNSTLEEALSQITASNQLFYKVQSPRIIIVVPDNVQKRAQYEEQVIRTFFVSHADATELAQTLNTVIRVGGGQVAPSISPNKTANTIVVRATTAVMAIIERLVDVNDNPRAEILVDVQILEVNKSRTKQFGLDLGDYTIQTVFSPTADPTGTTATAGGGTASTSTTLNQRPFNVNAVSRGINTADFWAAVPSAAVRFLESDAETRLVAKPQLRGAEGQKMTLNLGEEVPVPSTTFTPVAQGGAAFNPLTSFTYRPVGVNVEITPRVTYEGDITLELLIENSSLGDGLTVAGQSLPSFNSRKVQTRLRLRDGESNLLAGLLQEEERRSLRGFPGILRLPVIRQLFSSNDNTIGQTDIVMLLTPRIVRTHELSQQDVNPIFVGTQQNLGLQGPPPIIIQEVQVPAPAGAAGAAPSPAGAGQAGAPAVAPAPTPQVPTPAAPAAANPAATPAPTPGVPGASGGGQIVVSPPSAELRVGGGPYTLPISVTGASRLSSMSLTVTYNPAVVRVRTVQEGSFMRSGGVQASFTNRADASAGRVDIAIVRPGDTTGVAGTGLLAALVIDVIAPGPANLQVTGTGGAPGGAPISLQFATVTAVTAR